MSCENLKFSLTWESRIPIFVEDVLVIPKWCDQLSKDVVKEFFPVTPMVIEYGSGNGDWIIEKAKQFPNKVWIAVEMKFDRARKIWAKMRKSNLSNLRIVCGEAGFFTKHYLDEASVEEVFINFPDPWPKKKHAGRRLICFSFIKELTRIIKQKGSVTYLTDDTEYSQQMIKEMQSHINWKSVFADPYYIKEWPEYGSSWFEELWRKKNRDFYYIKFEKDENNYIGCKPF